MKWPEYPDVEALSEERKQAIRDARNNPYAVLQVSKHKWVVILRDDVSPPLPQQDDRSDVHGPIANWKKLSKAIDYAQAVRQARLSNASYFADGGKV